MRTSLLVALLLAFGCSSQTGGFSSEGPSSTPPLGIYASAGFLEVPPRAVTLHGEPVSIAATARLFANFFPADETPQNKPIFVMFNGFAADVVRAFGTGPHTVQPGGGITLNPSAFTRMANVLYIDPRQAGFSYDVIASRAQVDADCSDHVFNEYVDAGDVLFAVMEFLDDYPELQGPVVWIGESYAGTRLQWMLAFVRDRWELAPYRDPALESRLNAFSRRADLAKTQILLEPWLLGKAHADAIANACLDPALIASVEAHVPGGCAGLSACDCAAAHDLSPYDYAATNETQNARLLEADVAHVDPGKADRLFGLAVQEIDGLAPRDRRLGFKCSAPDASTPNEDALIAALGALPAGQNYFLPFSPLTPGHAVSQSDPGVLPDWQSTNAVGFAFVDNLRDVATFVTDGAFDLVVPERALTPGLRTILGAGAVSETAAGITVSTVDGLRSIAVFHYPTAGHMITMSAPSALGSDIQSWLAHP